MLIYDFQMQFAPLVPSEHVNFLLSVELFSANRSYYDLFPFVCSNFKECAPWILKVVSVIEPGKKALDVKTQIVQYPSTVKILIWDHNIHFQFFVLSALYFSFFWTLHKSVCFKRLKWTVSKAGRSAQ